MDGALLVLIVLVVAAIGLAVYATSKSSQKRNAASLADAKTPEFAVAAGTCRPVRPRVVSGAPQSRHACRCLPAC